MRILLAIALLALSGCVQSADWRQTAVRLEFERSYCSGTVVGPRLILTASHCFDMGGRLVKVAGKEAYALKAVKDGKDHTLVRVSITFKHWAKRGQAPRVEQRVRWYGNPAGEEAVYREGYVLKVKPEATLISAQIFKGDSGSGVFNEAGEVIAVISASAGPAPHFIVAIAMPLRFTDAQWRAMQG